MDENHYGDWLIVIPARLASTRLPEKPLQDLRGKPLIVRVAENLQPLSRKGAQVLVACDDPKILSVCKKNNITAVITDKSHESGTDRCHEASLTQNRKYILNVQGDEPFISTDDLELLMSSFSKQKDSNSIATLVHVSHDQNDFNNPNVCKTVLDASGNALYFSRAPIPHSRDDKGSTPFYQHVGVYGFTAGSLKKFCQFSTGKLEKIEKLEQLRALENGMTIETYPCQSIPLGIDTEDDMERARAKFN
ncbi:3-deoxy-manno-octulosonate cytidylyltransferase [Oligoflexaceae bacterium]|nr:3-deoxy-manno-octulosonate cytidylyltransferase [Oligoflexaceae bacterium]